MSKFKKTRKHTSKLNSSCGVLFLHRSLLAPPGNFKKMMINEEGVMGGEGGASTLGRMSELDQL